MENTHPKRFSIFFCFLPLIVISFYGIGETNKERERKERKTNQDRNKNEEDNGNEKTIF
jgi:hypothetical protein